MKIFLHFLRALTFLLLLLVVLAAGAVVVVWMKPELVLTPARIHQYVDKIPGIHFTQKPDQIDLHLAPHGFFGKKLTLHIGNFCIDQPEIACLDEIDIGLTFRFIQLTKIELEEVGPIHLVSKSLKLIPAAPATKKEEKPAKPFDFNAHLALADDFKIDEIEVQVPLLEIEDPKNPARVSASLIAPNPESLDVKGTYQTKDGLSASIKLHSSFSTPGKSPFDLSFNLKPVAAAKSSASGAVKGEFTWKDLGIQLRGQAEIKKLIPWVDTLQIRNLVLERSPTLKLSADLVTKLEPKINLNARDSAMPKATFNTDVRGKVELEQKDENYLFRVKLAAAPQKGLELAAHVEGEIPLALDEVYVDLKIPEFQTLVESLRRTNSAIPTPFNAMKGSVELRIGSDEPEHLDIKKPNIPLSFVTLLTSSEQQITTHSKGTIEFSSNYEKIKLNGETTVDSIRFTLPKFDVLNPNVALGSDSRIKSLAQIQKEELKKAKAAKKAERIKEKKPSESGFDYTWKITSPPGAIQIFYSVLVPYAPITADWTLSSTAPEGSLNLMPFDLHFLNRDAKVEFFKYFYKAEDKKYHYHGKLLIAKTDYNIEIEIIDETDGPKVVLTSEPPLSDSDIVSVLLFNQTSDELTPDESSSVVNTQAAVANRALGLFSIWALSSTPVEAVSYNPSSHVYSARVKLANGLTATIGTDWDNGQQVELRKRLGKNFVLSTILQSDSTINNGVTNVNDNADSKKALIEWFRRF